MNNPQEFSEQNKIRTLIAHQADRGYLAGASAERYRKEVESNRLVLLYTGPDEKDAFFLSAEDLEALMRAGASPARKVRLENPSRFRLESGQVTLGTLAGIFVPKATNPEEETTIQSELQSPYFNQLVIALIRMPEKPLTAVVNSKEGGTPVFSTAVTSDTTSDPNSETTQPDNISEPKTLVEILQSGDYELRQQSDGRMILYSKTPLGDGSGENQTVEMEITPEELQTCIDSGYGSLEIELEDREGRIQWLTLDKLNIEMQATRSTQRTDQAEPKETTVGTNKTQFQKTKSSIPQKSEADSVPNPPLTSPLLQKALELKNHPTPSLTKTETGITTHSQPDSTNTVRTQQTLEQKPVVQPSQRTRPQPPPRFNPEAKKSRTQPAQTGSNAQPFRSRPDQPKRFAPTQSTTPSKGSKGMKKALKWIAGTGGAAAIGGPGAILLSGFMKNDSSTTAALLNPIWTALHSIFV